MHHARLSLQIIKIAVFLAAEVAYLARTQPSVSCWSEGCSTSFSSVLLVLRIASVARIRTRRRRRVLLPGIPSSLVGAIGRYLCLVAAIARYVLAPGRRAIVVALTIRGVVPAMLLPSCVIAAGRGCEARRAVTLWRVAAVRIRLCLRRGMVGRCGRVRGCGMLG